MDSVACPFCDLCVPSSELQRHANAHFEDDEEQQRLAVDLELAQHLALVSPSPQSQKNLTISDLQFEIGFEGISSSSSSSSSGRGSTGEKANCLANLQIRSVFHRIEGGLMVLLRNCLKSEPGNTVSVLSGYVDHFQSTECEDVGWGCGWRNVQMLSSHLLFQRQEAREFLFGGSGFVPDIPSLQRWLEIAWEKGFDEPGAEHFNRRIYGSKKWIGTTECAALLRSFGLRAMVVDFGPKEFESLYLSVPGSSIGKKRRGNEVRGSMDRYVMRKNHEFGKEDSCPREMSKSSTRQLCDSSGCGNNTRRECKGRQVLVDWVRNYFSDKNSINSGNHRVIITNKAPLYFQHNGHSRTIVGVQTKYQPKGMPQHNLLILDPGHRTMALEKSLRENVGWQKLIKRGVHTLKKPQYQLCYVEPGICSQQDMESLKTINSEFFEI